MKQVIRGKRFVVLAILLRLLLPESVFASHTMGADLTYENLGGDTYRVTVSFYRDCIGIPAPANPLVTINSASCGHSMSVTCYPRPGTGQEVTPSCSSSVTTCNGGSFTGIQEWIYDGIVTLPDQCTDWVFGYALCCRNAAITTINNPATSTFYIYATLNNTIPNNSSPTFSNKPVPFLCLGQQFCFNHGAYDSDGDSLAYQLITPKQTASTQVNYIAPYTASNPLNSVPTTSFNPASGDICLTPQNLEVTVMAVLVSEYRNGVLIGSVERDLQLTVMNCANNLPSLTGIDGTNNFSLTVCANEPTCFDIFSNDPDNGQQLTVDWNYGIPGATFNSSSAAHPTGTFCWTPGTNEIGNTYSFTATVTDDACPYNGSQTYAYNITVVGMYVNAGLDQQIACSDQATLTAHATGGSGTYTYLWNTGSTMQSITVGAGTYIVTASDGQCEVSDTVNVTTPFYPTADFTNSAPNCNNDPISFTDLSTTPSLQINTWHWDFGDGDTSNVQNPIHQFAGPGSYNVWLTIENNLGCRDSIMRVIVIPDVPITDFSWGATCVFTSVSFTDLSTANPVIWNWDFGDGGTSTQQNPTHTYTSPGNYNVTLISENADGCSDTAVHTITVHPLPIADAGANQTICAGDPVTLSATGGVTYTWTPGGSGQVITINPSGSLTVIVTVTDSNGCSSNDTLDIIANPLPVVTASSDQTICNGNSVTLTANGAISYVWMPGNYTTSSISVSPASNTSYTVTGTDALGCTATDVVNVNVFSIPVADAGPDVTSCNGASVTLTATGGTSYSWSPGGSTNASITVNPPSTQTYYVTASNAGGCSSVDSVTVNVHQGPVVSLQSFFLCTGSNATLDAGNPGSAYVWNTGDTTQTIQINSGGNYSVTVTDANGCSASASCNVTYGSSITINLGNVSFCQGDSVMLDAGYPGLTYTWSPGGQTTQSIWVSTAGSYGVSVSDTSGCTGSITVSAMVNPLPVADFSSVPACSGNPVSFTDGSSISSGSITGWSWDFGDASTSTNQNPNHVYSSTGIYNVTLTATSAAGCTSNVTHPASVNPLPVAAFNYTNSCLGSAVNFTDASTVSSGNIVSYDWDFGDGYISSNQHPAHVYAAAGNYSVSLQVTTAGGCTNVVNQTVTVHPAPVASFTTSPVCLGNPTSFNNTSSISTGSITTYAWDFNDTYTSTQQSPSHTYNTQGSYAVSLIVTSNFGCSDMIVNTVQVNQLPLTDAGLNQPICNGSNAILTATGGTSYVWNPGNISGQTITVSPSSTTDYTVTVTDANGCTSTDAVSVSLNSIPTAQAGSDQAVCNGSSITLNGTGGMNYQWNPGGMTTASITVQPSSTTSYVLTVTDANGCTDTDTVNVTVNYLPVLSASPDNAICAGSTTSISASGASSYLWNPVGMTTATILVTPSSTTTYTVVGSNGSGCTSTETVTITVNPVPAINLSNVFICDGFTTTLDAGNPGSSYDWSTGETTQAITVSDSGIYSVIVTSANGCPGFATVTVTKGGSFNPLPINYAACNGQAATLNAGNPGGSYQWSTGETTQTISATAAGNYFVTVTDVNGCTGTMQHTLSINPLPVANFSTTNVCAGNAVSLNDNSTISSGSIQNVLWNFGDGNSSSAANTSHVYSTYGSYTVALTVTSAAGCSNSVSRPVTIHPLPNADFSNSATCQNSSVSFTNLSNIPSGTIASWNWNLGDGSNSTAISPSHNYAASGSYTAMLIAQSNFGCLDTMTRTVTVLSTPVAAFTAPNACTQSNINIVNNSSSSGPALSSYLWNFGNGTSSTQFQPSIQYNNSGTYSVSLIVTDVNGCRDTVTSPVTSYPLPVADFTAQSSCMNLPVAYLNNTSISSGNIQNYYWTLGDNSTSTLTHPYHTYSSDGSFTITMIAVSTFGCRDTAIKPITIHPVPQINITGQNVCLGNNVSFTNNSVISSGSITSWMWNFNDGTTSGQQNASHTFSQYGNHTVSLTATSDQGCVSNSNTTVNIFPNPVAAFTTSNVCFGSQTQLVNQSVIPGGGSLTSYWEYGDGTHSNAGNPLHAYANPGTYNVLLTVTSANGCTDDVIKGVSVYNLPMARFSAPDNCSGLPTPFTNQSTSLDGPITAYLWGFGDGTFSFDENPVHHYADSGQYSVDLVTITSYGCSDDYNESVAVFANPDVTINMNNSCVGSLVNFSQTGASGNVNYTWNIQNTYVTTQPTFNYSFNTPGTYTVSLTAMSDMGCSGAATDQLHIYPNPVAGFSSNEVCYASQTEFNNLSSIPTGNISSYSWSFGDNQHSNQRNPNHTYTSSGTFNAVLTITSDQGCSANITQQVIVHPNPIPAFAAGAQGCGPITASFVENSTISSGTIAGRLWNFGDGGVSTDVNPMHVFNQAGSYDVTLTVVSDRGCQASVTHSNVVNVFPGPVADFTADPMIVDALMPIVNFQNQSVGYTSYQWLFGDGTSTSTELNPTHTFGDTGTYYAMLITVNNFGCVDTVQRNIEVRLRSTLYIANCFTPNGDGNNDDFRPFYTNMEEIQVWIFDRWGKLLYSWNDLNGSWNGTYNGTKCQTDTYVYKIAGKGLDGKLSEWVGHVSIVY